MNIPIIGPIVRFVSQMGNKYMERKLVESEGRIEIAKAQATAAAEIAVTQATAEVQWNQTMAEASKTSWKDEYWTLLLGTPLVLAFIPAFTPFVMEGFRVLREDVPEWYLMAVFAAISAAFGKNLTTSLLDKWRANRG